MLLEAWRFYRYDLILVFADTMVEAEALGCRVALPEDDDAYLLTSPEHLPEASADPLKAGRMPVTLEATRLLVGAAGQEVPILTSLKGPFSLAAFLLGVEEFLMSLRTAPDASLRALEIALGNQIRYADAIIDSGGIPFIGDPLASGDIISPRDFATSALPYLQRLVRHIRARVRPVGLHICGEATGLLPLLAQTEAEILSLDEVDLKVARRALGDDVVLMGNVPTQLIAAGTAEEVKRSAEKCLVEGGPRMILASACDVPTNAPVENVKAIVEAGREACSR